MGKDDAGFTEKEIEELEKEIKKYSELLKKESLKYWEERVKCGTEEQKIFARNNAGNCDPIFQRKISSCIWRNIEDNHTTTFSIFRNGLVKIETRYLEGPSITEKWMAPDSLVQEIIDCLTENLEKILMLPKYVHTDICDDSSSTLNFLGWEVSGGSFGLSQLKDEETYHLYLIPKLCDEIEAKLSKFGKSMYRHINVKGNYGEFCRRINPFPEGKDD